MSLDFLENLSDQELEKVINRVRSIANKRYYEANKASILTQQKEYRTNKKRLKC